MGPWSDSAPANGIQIELAHFAQELKLKFVNTFDPCSNPIFARDSLFGRNFDSTEFWTWSPDDGSAPKQYDFILANHDSEGVAFTTYNLDCNSDHRLFVAVPTSCWQTNVLSKTISFTQRLETRLY